jgi:hypothetical protein
MYHQKAQFLISDRFTPCIMSICSTAVESVEPIFHWGHPAYLETLAIKVGHPSYTWWDSLPRNRTGVSSRQLFQ